MRYENFINELKNIPTIKEKQDALDAINLSSKILFDINKKALESHPQETPINDLRKELFKTKDELAIKKEQNAGNKSLFRAPIFIFTNRPHES